MRSLKTLFDFYINSSIHVALAVSALSWVTLIQFELNYDADVLIFTFFASITGYNFVKFFGIAKFHHRKLTSRLKSIQLFSLIAFVGMSVFFFRLQRLTMLYIGILGLVTFLYAVPMLPKHLFIDKQKNLRSISGLKIYIIAMVWTGVTVLLPLIDNNIELENNVWIRCFERFLIVIVLMLPFEIRDLNFDSLKLSTIPQKIGVNGTKWIGVIILISSFGLNFLIQGIDKYIVLTNGIFTIVLALFLLLSFQKQSKYYTSFWVESLPIWWLGLLLMLG